MSVTNTTNKITTAGNGVTTAFSYPFKVFDTSQLAVYTVIAATGVATGPLTLGVHYTATINSVTEGGVVTMVTAPATGTNLFVKRIVDLEQTAVIPTEGVFPEQVIEDQLDKNVMMLIQVSEAVDRALKVDVTSSAVIVLPSPLDGYSLAWDGTTGLLKNVLIDSSSIAVQVAAAAASASAASASATSASTSSSTATTSKNAAAASATAAAASAAAAAASGVNGPSFCVTKAGTQSVSNGVDTLITFDTVNVDSGSYFSTSTGKYTPLTSGKYCFLFQGQFSGLADNIGCTFTIKKNGTVISQTTSKSTGNLATVCGTASIIVNMNGSTDYVQAYAEQDDSGALNMGGTPTVFLMGHKVSS